MSEIFIPTSLWEQTRGLKYQIFEAMDATFLRDIMIEYISFLFKLNVIVLSTIVPEWFITICFSRLPF
jgi:hypothetical protein